MADSKHFGCIVYHVVLCHRAGQVWWGVITAVSVYTWEQYSIANPMSGICTCSDFSRNNSSCTARSSILCPYTYWCAILCTKISYTQQDVQRWVCSTVCSSTCNIHSDKYYTMQTAVLFIGIETFGSGYIYDMSVCRIGLMMSSRVLGCASRAIWVWWRVLKATEGWYIAGFDIYIYICIAIQRTIWYVWSIIDQW